MLDLIDNLTVEIYQLFNFCIEGKWECYNGKINVIGNVDLSRQKLIQIPVKFGFVSGNFHCNANQLTSLKNCPHQVDGIFNCHDNPFILNDKLFEDLRQIGKNKIGGYLALMNQLYMKVYDQFGVTSFTIANPIWESYKNILEQKIYSEEQLYKMNKVFFGNEW